MLATDTTDATAPSLTFPAENLAKSAKGTMLDHHLRVAYQKMESEINDARHAGEVFEVMMDHYLGTDDGINSMTKREWNTLFYAMYRLTNATRDLHEKYYAGFKAIPTHGAA